MGNNSSNKVKASSSMSCMTHGRFVEIRFMSSLPIHAFGQEDREHLFQWPAAGCNVLTFTLLEKLLPTLSYLLPAVIICDVFWENLSHVANGETAE